MNNQLYNYLLRLGDTSLILGQRLGEWCGHGPILEEDIAMTNISLDLIGQSRALLTYAGELEGKGKTEDDLAYQRGERQYYNFLLVEQPNGDFAKTMMRQFLVSTFQYYHYAELKSSKDMTLSALAEKSLKEVAYHLRHSSEWIKRLGGGTEESKQRIKNALEELWLYTGDMFDADETDVEMLNSGIGVDLQKIKPMWDKKVAEVFSESGLEVPQNVFMVKGSRAGRHTEQLGHLLAEMQTLQRTYPGSSW
jgi:ring-1,2-phenylacetyl-CoA epoxidase subunit PaaC